MANRVKSKGTAFLMSISSVYTAVTGLKSVSLAGEKSETFPSHTLDTGVFKTHDPTGYSDTCVITADVFYDPDDTVHAAFIALIAAPVATNFKVTYADTTPLSAIYSGVGFGFDKTATPGDGLSGTMTVQTSGTPSS